LVSTTSALSSTAIRIGTWSEVSHARLYIGAGQVVEAVGDGVVLAQLEDVVAHGSSLQPGRPILLFSTGVGRFSACRRETDNDTAKLEYAC
ncbi:MAG: hypothetical protein MOB07_22405, partial [Acidobacteria bacterium]|nr:hypothetical protein [Acidobacteriota bacterium]